MKILFIGNSYTYYNDMPKMFEKIATDNGKDVQTFSVTKGGRKLIEHINADDEYSHKIDELIENHKFDICFIQEQSFLPLINDKLFTDGVLSVAEKIKNSVNKIILYATWGRKDGHSILEQYNWTNKSMTFDLANAYKKAAELIGADMSYVGLNFYDVYGNHKEINLYDEDLTHPSYEGSCLAMLTHYMKVFNEFPENLSSLSLTESQISVFKNVIYKNHNV